jgi:1-deoxy-D-xylulose-5-phosphate reductoisomerase
LKSKKVSVLGCTGSIGKNTLEVVKALEPCFDIVALACRRNVRELAKQVREFTPTAVAVAGPLDSKEEGTLAELQDIRIYRGEEGLLQMIADTEVDVVVNGISGAMGLLPSLKTLQGGADLALANKETIVMAGDLVSELVRRKGSKLLPVDSEHHALFCLLQGRSLRDVQEIILTASGGAFRDLSYEQLKDVRVEDALNHPNWDMGAKITVDSATMANKGLEVIEAHHLFDVPVSTIKVLIHPQSYIHSLIRTTDGFIYGQLSQPDMRLPIQNALTYPDLKPSCVQAFDLTGKNLSFEPVDREKYRMLPLAYEAAEQAGGYPIAYNAANEVAVERFLRRELTFLEVPRLVEQVLQLDWQVPVQEIEAILHVDRRARIKAEEILKS